MKIDDFTEGVITRVSGYKDIEGCMWKYVSWKGVPGESALIFPDLRGKETRQGSMSFLLSL